MDNEKYTLDAVENKPEELVEAEHNFIPEDLEGGLHNVKPPQEFYDKQKRMEEEAAGFIIMNDSATNSPQKTDGVLVAFTPEELVILTQILENYAVHMRDIDYVYDELGVETLYHQQAIVRQLRDNVNGTLDHYVRVRPYSPFIAPWFKRIGKGKVRNEGQN